MKEKISALMDGELEDREAAGAIGTLQGDGDARDAWRAYHLIGDAMRDTRALSPGFADRVAARLAQEPTVLAPRRLKPEARPWYAIPAAAAAGVAGVSLVGYLAFAPRPDAPAVARAPQAPVAAPAQPQVATVPLPSGADDYILAHQGFSPRVSLQGMAPYARTVSSRSVEPRR
ncbi:MAG TPA: sigma-E factor negative regulatory protein [Burkholderiales bacterium]|nr:sigma-E factor negative regulatory protein [Burkholderiales bacterium]